MYEEFEDAKWAIRSNKSKDRQYNGQNEIKKNKRTKHYPQDTAEHTQVWETWTPLKQQWNRVLRKGEQYLLH